MADAVGRYVLDAALAGDTAAVGDHGRAMGPRPRPNSVDAHAADQAQEIAGTTAAGRAERRTWLSSISRSSSIETHVTRPQPVRLFVPGPCVLQPVDCVANPFFVALSSFRHPVDAQK